MLFNFLYPYADDITLFNLFRYLTFRTGGAIMTALIISFILGPTIINWLKSQQGSASNIREDLPETHFKKAGTPTMGRSQQRLCLDRAVGHNRVRRGWIRR